MGESLASAATEQQDTAGTPDPLVGLGMPVYNGERYLADALRSILAQTFRDFELVICDNASTDGTEAICRQFAREDPRVRYFRNECNLGAHPNYNRAFGLSRGRLFKWVAHDDLLQPDYLEACVRALEGDPRAVLCQSDIEYIDEGGISRGFGQGVPDGSTADRVADRFAALALRAHNAYGIMALFRREALAQSMLLPSFHGADRALLAELALRGPFVRVCRPLLKVRDHAARYSNAMKRPQDRARWHDTRLTGRWVFPTWRLYATYWSALRRSNAGLAERSGLAWVLLRWWFVNWNAARMSVDLIAAVYPGAVWHAERWKQRWFSPAPGLEPPATPPR